MTPQEKVDRAKTRIILIHPWWATIMLNLRFTEDGNCPTLATDAISVFWNPTFVDGLPSSELEAVILHELAHVALLHCFRRRHRDHLRWNIACDAAVNAILRADNIVLPAGCVPPVDLSLTAEEIYESLPEEADNCPALDVLDGVVIDGAGVIDGMSERAWRDILQSARGLLPDSLRRSVEAATESIVDWRYELALFISSFVPSSDKTWMQPSRRYSPAAGRKRIPEIKLAVCVDTSGSVDARQLIAFLSECRAIMSISGVSAHIIAADAAVHEIVGPDEPFPAFLTGGGGTSFVPTIRKAEELEIDGLVYLTDGDGTFPDLPPQIEVLWALTRKVSVPFGRTIYIRREGK